MFRVAMQATMMAVFLITVVGCGAISTKDRVGRLEQERLDLLEQRNRLQSQIASMEGQERTAKRAIQKLQGELRTTQADYADLYRVTYKDEQETGSAAEPTAGVAEINNIEGVEARLLATGEVLLTLEQAILFQSGSATVTKKGALVLRKIAGVIKVQYPNGFLRIVGHSDNVPVKKVKKKFPSNWELSSVRACSVLRSLQAEGAASADRFEVIGRADTHPIADNSTKAGRKANRRVEIFVRR